MLTVVEALIELGRMDDAEKLINISRENIKPWEYGSMTSQLAMAKNDAQGIIKVADYFEAHRKEFQHPFHHMCVGMMDVYLRGVASYLEGDYEHAAEWFAGFEDASSQVGCRKTEIKMELMVLLYRAAALRHLNSSEAEIQILVSEVDKRLHDLETRGWDTPMMAKVKIARHALVQEEEAVANVVEQMQARGWKPFGMIKSSPILREIVQNLDSYQKTFEPLSQQYASMQQECEQIVLAKIGL